VDIPTAVAVPRVFLDGDDGVYNRGSVINELRDPFLQAPPLPRLPSPPPPGAPRVPAHITAPFPALVPLFYLYDALLLTSESFA